MHWLAGIILGKWKSSVMNPKLRGPAKVLTRITVGSWNNNPDRILNHDPVPKAKDMICSIRPSGASTVPVPCTL